MWVMNGWQRFLIGSWLVCFISLAIILTVYAIYVGYKNKVYQNSEMYKVRINQQCRLTPIQDLTPLQNEECVRWIQRQNESEVLEERRFL